MLDGGWIPFKYMRHNFNHHLFREAFSFALSSAARVVVFYCTDYMNEPESISNIIEGLIECFYLDELEKEADAWDALTFEQKYGTLEGAK